MKWSTVAIIALYIGAASTNTLIDKVSMESIDPSLIGIGVYTSSLPIMYAHTILTNLRDMDGLEARFLSMWRNKMTYVASLSGVLEVLSYYLLLQKFDANQVTLFAPLEIVVTCALTFLTFGERLNLIQTLGIGVVALGLLVYHLGDTPATDAATDASAGYTSLLLP